jgi:hypothetical protein
MSRPSSPFVDVDLNDETESGGSATLQTRLLYMDTTRTPNQSSARAVRELAEFDERLERCRQKRAQVEARREAIQAEFHQATTNGEAVAGRATAPPSSFSSDDVDDVGIGQPSMPRMEDPTDGSSDRASALSFITDQSISSLVRRLRQSASQNSGLPTPHDVDAFLLSNPTIKAELEAKAANAYNEYDSSEDPRLHEMQCTICLDIPMEPVALFDQMYCDRCIREALTRDLKCPNTRRTVALSDVRPNKPVKNLIHCLIEQGSNEVVAKRKEFVILLATKRIMEQLHTGQSAALVSEIEQRLESVSSAQRELQDAARRRREEQRLRLQRLEEENRRMRAEGTQHQRDLEMELQQEGETIRSHFRNAAATLQQKDARLKDELRLLDIEEAEIKRERSAFAAAIVDQERASHGHRIVRRTVQPGGQKCFRCGLHKSMQTLASMHRCFRCSHTFCHDCCNNVGGVLVNPEANDDESDDEAAASSESLECVKICDHGLKILGWRRICSACYTTCLRGRLEIEQSGGALLPAGQTTAQLFPPNESNFTEDRNVLMYVLTQQERQSWLYFFNDIPRGLIEEWKICPSRAAVLFDKSVLAAQNEVLPALAEKSKLAFEKLKFILLDLKDGLSGNREIDE